MLRSRMMRVASRLAAALVLVSVFAGACGKDGSSSTGPGGGNPPENRATSILVMDGDLQAATVGTAVAVRPTVLVLNDDGAPVAGVTVRFTVATGNGTVSGNVVTTGPDGMATVGQWRLGPLPGLNQLRAAATGLPDVIFTAEGEPAAFLVVIENQLAYPIQVSVAGIQGVIQGSTTNSVEVEAPPASFPVQWSLIRPTPLGPPLGDPMSGAFTVQTAAGSARLVVDNLVGDQWYFRPLVSNSTASSLLMSVNGGLVSENRCNCAIAPFQQNVHLGYYRLYANTELRAYHVSSNYTGGYTYFHSFASNVQRGSGELLFNFTLPPP